MDVQPTLNGPVSDLGMELVQADTDRAVVKNMVGEVVADVHPLPEGMRFLFQSGRTVDLSYGDLLGHAEQPGEKLMTMVVASYHTSGRKVVTYHHKDRIEPDWTTHRGALKSLVAEIKRNIRWGPRACPFAPGRKR